MDFDTKYMQMMRGLLYLKTFSAKVVVVGVLYLLFSKCCDRYAPFFSWFDALVVVCLVVANKMIFRALNTTRALVFYVVVSFPVFAIILPLVSMVVELGRSRPTGLHDSYEFLYVYLRFPQYWVLGAVQFAIWVTVAIRCSLKAKKNVMIS